MRPDVGTNYPCGADHPNVRLWPVDLPFLPSGRDFLMGRLCRGTNQD